MWNNTYNLLVILGPTASGKTKLAVHLAHALNAEIISADSRQVYRDMNIGTGKDYQEYSINGKLIPYHLIDILEAGSKYHVNRFKEDFENAFSDIQRRNILPILCGGSGLYIHSILADFTFTAVPKNESIRENLNTKSLVELQHIFNDLPKTAYTHLADLTTQKRSIRAIEICLFLNQNPEFRPDQIIEKKPMIIGINPDLETRRERISNRLKQRLKEGLVEEVASLAGKGIDTSLFEYYGLEYKFVWRFLQNQINEQQLFELLEIAIHQYAKRQMTYFRKMEKDGIKINWINGDLSFEDQISEAMKIMDKN